MVAPTINVRCEQALAIKVIRLNLMLFFYEFIFSITAAKPKAKINQSRYSVAIAGVSNISIPPNKASKIVLIATDS